MREAANARKVNLRTVCGLIGLGLLLAGLAGCPLGNDLTVTVGDDTALVIGQSYVIPGVASGGTEPYTYAWSPSAGLSSITVAQPTFTPTTVGEKTYTLTVTDANGATASDSVKITVTTSSTALTASAGNDLISAVGVAVTLSGSATGGNDPYTYAWTPTTGLSDATSATPTFTPTATGTFVFTLTVTDSEGTTDTDEVQVTVGSATLLDSLTWAANYSAGGYSVTAVFNSTLDKTTAETEANYRINGTSTNPASATLATDNKTLTLIFNTPLSVNSTLDLSVSNGIKDSNGASVPALSAQSIAANTSDITGPTISTIKWAANYAGSYQISVEYSEAVSAATAQTTTAYRINGTSTTASSATLSNDGKTVLVVFQNVALAPTDKLDVNVGSGLRDINNRAGSQALAQAITANSADTTAPNITAIRHAAGFSSGGYNVLVTFNEAMSKTTAEDENAYRIGSDLATTATLGTDGRTVTLQFDVPLTIDDALDVSVGGVIEDINGNNLAVQNDQAISASTTDTSAPQVSTRKWGANVTSGYEVEVVFNEAMDEESVEDVDHWLLAGTATKPSSVTLDTDGLTATLVFGVPLSTDDKLDISVGSAIEDINGNALTALEDQTISSNSADTTAPTVASRTWDDGGADYGITVVYSEAMDETTVETGTNYSISGVNAATATLANDGKTVTLTFPAAGAFSIDDDLTVSSSVKDINGRAAANSTDAVDPDTDDTTDPSIDSIQWTASYGGGGYRVEVTFDEAMDEATTETVANWQLNGATNPSTASLGSGGTVVTLTFTGAGLPGAGQQVDVSALGTIKDINGNALAEQANQAIAVNAGDTTDPSISSIKWGSEQTSYTVIVAFSEALDKTSAETEANYALQNGDDVAPNSATLGTDGKTVTLVWTAAELTQPAAITDTVDISVSDTVEDVNGNALEEAAGETIDDNTADTAGPAAPTVGHGAAAVTVTLTFDEVMDETSCETTGFTTTAGGVTQSGSAALSDSGLVLTITFSADPGDGSAGEDITIPAGLKDINGNAYAGATLTIPN